MHPSCLIQVAGSGIANHENALASYQAARQELEYVEEDYRRMGWHSAIGSSGTIRNVWQITQNEDWSRKGISARGLAKLSDVLVETGRADKRSLRGLQPELSGWALHSQPPADLASGNILRRSRHWSTKHHARMRSTGYGPADDRRREGLQPQEVSSAMSWTNGGRARGPMGQGESKWVP